MRPIALRVVARVRAALGGLCAGIVLWSSAARGQSRSKVVALVDQPNVALLPRIAAELASSDFDVIVVAFPHGPPTQREVEDLVRANGARAGLSLGGPGPEVGVWIVDPTTGATAFREAIVVVPDRADAGDVVAIRIVETLRAALAHVGAVPTPPTVAAPLESGTARSGPTPTVPPTYSNATAPRFVLGVRGGAAYSPGGVAVMGLVGLSFRWAMTARLHLGADALLTPVDSSVSGPEGRAAIALDLAGTSIGGYVSRPDARLQVRAAVGVWASLLTMAGEARLPYVGRHADVFSLVPHADVGARVRVTARLALGAELSCGIATPRAAVQLGDRQAATWGAPLLIGLLTVDSTLD